MEIDSGKNDLPNEAADETPIPVSRRQASEEQGAPAVGRDDELETRSIVSEDGEPHGLSQDMLADPSNAPLTHYSSRSEIRNPVRLLGDLVGDVSKGRELAWRLFVRNLRGLYRQTFLGLFWAFLPPIANTAFWVFLRQAKVFSTTELQVHHTVYILTSMIFWQAFIDAFQMPLNMLNKNRNMISKLNFPRESLLMVGLGEVVFDLLIRLLLLIPAFWFYGVTLHASVLLIPFALIALIMVGAGLGLLILPVGSLYQDVGRFISIALPFWMILTPIIYVPFTEFPGSLLNWINPASPLIIVARDWALMGGTSYGVIGWTYGLVALPLFVLGLVVYRVSIPVLIERMNA
ncbi:MAG: ABC transporter permease [Planctomycetota bacterium]